MEGKKIYPAISNIMKDIGVVGKDQRNKQQGYQYRGVDDVMNALNPALAKNNVFVVPEVLSQEREERSAKSGGNLLYSILTVKYTFYAEDGSSISTTVIGEGMDSGDKASNKAMSVAFKYACFQVFCIPTEEMIDADSETPEESEAKKLSCSICGGVIKGYRKDGKEVNPKQVSEKTDGLCIACWRDQYGK